MSRPSRLTPLKTVGHPTARIDAVERVTGKATYTGDIHLPGMLYARVLRSPHAHARIRQIDSSKALALPGVKFVLTHENCSVVWGAGSISGGRQYVDDIKKITLHKRYLFNNPVRFFGEPVAAVAATNRHLAAEALRLINVAYEALLCAANWEGDKLTLYTPTQGTSNCRHDMARDLGIPDEKVRVICKYMGGGFGNKNQNQDADLIAAVLAKETGAPVKLEMSRKEDFIGVHGRWPTTQYYKVGVSRQGVLQALQLRGYSGMGPYRKNTGGIGGIELYQCPNVESVIYPVYTNRAVSGNYRAPEFPQGFFGIESMMDDVAYKMKMDPVEFVLKNMTRKSDDEVPYSNYTLDDCIRRGAEAFGWKKRWHPPGADKGPIKRGVGMSFMALRSPTGQSSAVIRLDSNGRYTVFVGVTDIGAGAKTTMALIAAEALGVPLSNIEIVWGDTDRCPYSVGESGSRTTDMTGYAVIEAARDLQRQIVAKGLPKGDNVLIASATPNPTSDGKVRKAFGAHFVEVEVDTELGRVRVLKYLAAQDSGRILHPLTATSQVKGGATQGIGMALHEDLLYDQQTGQPLTAGYYGTRIMTHLDAPEIEVIFIESDDGYGPFGAKCIGEAGIVHAVAGVGNAVFNAIGRRMKDLPITRDKILGALV